MQPSDRADFVKLAEALFAAFDKPAVEARLQAYWLGLQSMHLLAFDAVVRHVIGPDGEDELPTPKQLYAINRRLQADKRAAELAGRKPQLRPGEEPPAEPDRFEAYANRVMVAVLCQLIAQHGSAASDSSLAAMVHVKHQYAVGYREMCLEDPDASLEMRDALVAALTTRFVPRDQPREAEQPAAPVEVSA